MAEAASGNGPGNSQKKGDVSGRTPSGDSALTARAVESGAGGIQLPAWTKALGWCGVAGLIYLLICAVTCTGAETAADLLREVVMRVE